MMLIPYKKYLVITFIFSCIVILFYTLGFKQYITLANVQKYSDVLHYYVREYYWGSVFLYVMLFIFATVCALPITIVLTMSGGFFFGIVCGTLLAVLSATFGGLIIFTYVRSIRVQIIQRKYDKELQKFNANIIRYGHWYLLALQVFPLTPPFLPYVFSGLSTMHWWQVAWASAIGLVPGTALYAWMGEYVHFIKSERDLFSWTFFNILVLLTILALLPIVWKKYMESE